MALEVGAQPYGHWSCCHASAWDLLADDVGHLRSGAVHVRFSYPIGIVVNRRGQRFVDEGADFRNYTYAKYGREILKQPGRQAFQIFDNQTIPLLGNEYRTKQATKARANTIEELGDQLPLDPAGLRRTIDEFNAAVQDGEFNPEARTEQHSSRRGSSGFRPSQAAEPESLHTNRYTVAEHGWRGLSIPGNRKRKCYTVLHNGRIDCRRCF